jgi:hypothetical protein
LQEADAAIIYQKIITWQPHFHAASWLICLVVCSAEMVYLLNKEIAKTLCQTTWQQIHIG